MKKKIDHGWKEIPGYRFRYRINEDAVVQKQMEDESWYTLRPYISGRRRAAVKMRTADNRKVDVPVVWLMADAFMGGRKPGTAIVHKNGSKLDCSIWNLKVIPRKECAKFSCMAKRKAVMKIDREGNVVAVYPSGREAAKENYISQNSIWARCQGKVKDPYRLDGYDYRYEKEIERRERKMHSGMNHND